MAGEPQGLATFPGVNQVVRASYTLSHGVSPGVCTMEIAPQLGGIKEGGTLRFRFGDVELAFPDCRADLATAGLTADGLIWSIRILDRRWKWQFGETSGEYNRRDGKGKLINEKTPQEIAEILLEAAGEDADVSEIPNDGRPHVEWTAENPMQALASLCDDLGCRIVMRLDSTIRIERSGQGGLLPTDWLMTQTLENNPPERPDTIRVIGSPTIVQCRMDLEAVGRDTDGSIKPIDELSYKPEAGWGKENPYTFPNVPGDTSAADVLAAAADKKELSTEDAKTNAIQTVFRWYRITEGALTSLNVPDIEPPRELEEILPLEQGLVDTYLDNGEEKPKSPKVYGVYWIENSDVTAPVNSVQFRDYYRYKGDFQVDYERGIVQFARPVQKWDSEADAFAPAEMVLECAFSIRDTTTFAPHRITFDYQMPGPKLGTKPYIVKRTGQDDRTGKKADLQIRWKQVISEGRVDSSEFVDVRSDNDDPKRKALYYALAAAQRFIPQVSGTGVYAGLLPINLDGAIQQVTWSVGPSGATTEASRNSEHSDFIPAYNQRRFSESMGAILAKLK